MEKKNRKLHKKLKILTSIYDSEEQAKLHYNRTAIQSCPIASRYLPWFHSVECFKFYTLHSNTMTLFRNLKCPTENIGAPCLKESKWLYVSALLNSKPHTEKSVCVCARARVCVCVCVSVHARACSVITIQRKTRPQQTENIPTLLNYVENAWSLDAHGREALRFSSDRLDTESEFSAKLHTHKTAQWVRHWAGQSFRLACNVHNFNRPKRNSAGPLPPHCQCFFVVLEFAEHRD